MRIFFLLSLFLSVVKGDVYSKGNVNLGITVGSATSFNETYTFAGISGEYCVVDNLAAGSAYRRWFGKGPSLDEFSLYSSYFFYFDKKIRPYGGVFVRETLVRGGVINDFFSYGLRGGISYIPRKNSYVTFGYAMEYYDKCVLSEKCHRSYPELNIGIAF